MSRIVRVIGRVKAYITECKHSMTPMPNPEWYEEQKHTRVNLSNLRKLPLSVHKDVWSSTWRWYVGSFQESFAWGRKRKEEAKKKDTMEKIGVLQGIVKGAREATHNTPEDLEESKKALKELLEEIHENRDEIKTAAQEKLDLIRVSLTEFSAGYRESRDAEMKRVMSMDKSVLQSFLTERLGEAKRASTILSDVILTDENAEKASTKPSSPAPKQPDIGNGTVGLSRAVGDQDEDERRASDSALAAEAENEPLSTAPRDLLSKRARGAVDEVFSDPDIERLIGRAGGFARERLLQAESAARILKGEEAAEGARPGSEEGDGKTPGDAASAGSSAPPSGSETPIISGLASEARDFVSDRVGQARGASREVVGAAIDARRSRQTAKAERGEGAGKPGSGKGGGDSPGDKGYGGRE